MELKKIIGDHELNEKELYSVFFVISLVSLMIISNVIGVERLNNNDKAVDYMGTLCNIAIAMSVLSYVAYKRSSIKEYINEKVDKKYIKPASLLIGASYPLGLALYNFDKLKSVNPMLCIAPAVVGLGLLALGLRAGAESIGIEITKEKNPISSEMKRNLIILLTVLAIYSSGDFRSVTDKVRNVATQVPIIGNLIHAVNETYGQPVFQIGEVVIDNISVFMGSLADSMNINIVQNPTAFSSQVLAAGNSVVQNCRDVKVVISGDTLNEIARSFGITSVEIMNSNPFLNNPNNIEVGQQLCIP